MDSTDGQYMPACGTGWSATRIAGELEGLNDLPPDELAKLRWDAAAIVPQEKLGAILEAGSDTTEVVIYASQQHQVLRGERMSSVCMISWQATHADGDWKTNLMLQAMNFPFGPDGLQLDLPKGLVLAYQSARFKLKEAFHRKCCSTQMLESRLAGAPWLVISGHSHGGALAEMNAIDVINNWYCDGKDITAQDMALIMAAPHASMLPMSAVTNVFSCPDKSRCLAGRVVTLVTERDPVGSGIVGLTSLGAPKHPSRVTELKCGDPPTGEYTAGQVAGRLWFPHEMNNYLQGLEDQLVDKSLWGSSCAGECGNVNIQLQCHFYLRKTNRGCKGLTDLEIDRATACDNTKWRPKHEKCECKVDNCMHLLEVCPVT
eukprot:CAMPEP_0168461926 /NCGR_PEP_ID=MMETSP0228-20121227/54244_1 /TAXON_ID=133427 /ORGANISM="Protoceratium reticulatum, Strain CCCM 535 (=CCMP 1889)" /LENGTH=373 /DNA_ID=CAMNT_0008477271 /DNA_START=219 /DNA_END=1340 /DNA_ORIENTATION=+